MENRGNEVEIRGGPVADGDGPCSLRRRLHDRRPEGSLPETLLLKKQENAKRSHRDGGGFGNGKKKRKRCQSIAEKK